MAYQYDGSGIVITQTATADLSGSQYRLVKVDTNTDGNVVICGAVTDKPLGVLLNKPAAGQAATILCAGVTQLASGAAVANGDTIGVDITGRGVNQAPVNANPVFGQALSTSGGAGQIITVAINCLSSQPGA